MRTIRAARAHVPEHARGEYLALLEEYGRVAGASAQVKGFYVMENEAAPGDVFEFVEFADSEAAAAFEVEEREHAELRAVLTRLRAIVPAERVDATLWRQRL